MNLTANAVKFTEQGSIHIRVEIKNQSGKEILLLFTIEDTGIGIEPSKIEDLFTPFTQADQLVTRKYGGTGLGLAISAQLVKLMKGTIWVTSIPHQGSTFFFTFSTREGSAANSNVERGNRFDTSLARKHPLQILIAEDNPVNQQVALLILKKMGYNPDLAKNGFEVLQKLENQDYDLVFMDIQMPEKDGIATTREIHKIYKDAKRPVIVALTADVIPEKQETYLAAGMDDVLSKPISIAEISEIIGKWSGKISQIRQKQ